MADNALVIPYMRVPKQTDRYMVDDKHARVKDEEGDHPMEPDAPPPKPGSKNKAPRITLSPMTGLYGARYAIDGITDAKTAENGKKQVLIHFAYPYARKEDDTWYWEDDLMTPSNGQGADLTQDDFDELYTAYLKNVEKKACQGLLQLAKASNPAKRAKNTAEGGSASKP
jgi:hypothetical protein